LTLGQVAEWVDVARNKKLHETTRRVATERALKMLNESMTFFRKLPDDGPKVRMAIQLKAKIEKLQTSLALPVKRGRRTASKTRGAHAAVEAILTSTHLAKRSVPIAEQVLAALEGR
jgi:hypothetical protein